MASSEPSGFRSGPANDSNHADCLDTGPSFEALLAELVRLVRAGLARDIQLINSRQLAELLAVSPATLERMRSSGRLLEPVELSRGCLRYRLAAVREWIDNGCPPLLARRAQQR
jgi:predicted DNA-binding transcriptional regulator AlpA